MSIESRMSDESWGSKNHYLEERLRQAVSVKEDAFEPRRENVTQAEDPGTGTISTTASVGLLEGAKFDQDKIRMDLFPPEAIEAISDILTFGAQKYEARNWEKGMAWSRPFGAMMRHMWAWWRGEDKDAETGKSHLWHAGCCIVFLIAYEMRKTGTDDRYKTDPR